MHLGGERIQQVINNNLRAGTLLTCHAARPTASTHFGPAVCAGFWARHCNAVPAGRLAQLVLGIIRIQPRTTGLTKRPKHEMHLAVEMPNP